MLLPECCPARFFPLQQDTPCKQRSAFAEVHFAAWPTSVCHQTQTNCCRNADLHMGRNTICSLIGWSNTNSVGQRTIRESHSLACNAMPGSRDSAKNRSSSKRTAHSRKEGAQPSGTSPLRTERCHLFEKKSYLKKEPLILKSGTLENQAAAFFDEILTLIEIHNGKNTHNKESAP